MQESELNDLATERSAIARMGSLHRMHWIVVGLSLLLTFGAWYITREQINSRVADRFDRNAAQVLELVSERLQKYEDALWGGVAAIQAAGGDISYDKWRTYADTLNIETKYPGINGIGVIHHVQRTEIDNFLARQRLVRPEFRIHPDQPGDDLFPITYIEPSALNAAAVGLDIAHEANRLSAARRAGDIGAAQITAPIVLVQDAERTPGFLFYAPFYTENVSSTLAQRRDNFGGLVYAPFIFHKLVEGVLGRDSRLVRFSIHDNDDVLFDEGDTMPEGFVPQFTKTRTLNLYGRVWTFKIWDAPQFQALTGSSEPMMILIGGLFIDTMLLILFVTLARSNRRALAFADRMSQELTRQMHSLAQSNKELEQFAYVTSHDLKTPLRGIGYLLDYLGEELEPFVSGPEDTQEIEDNLTRLHGQVRRMENLIAGILEYSSIQNTTNKLSVIDTHTLVREICYTLDLRQDQFVFDGHFPEFTTDSIRLEQVLTNLISNARKYNDNPDTAVIRINVRDMGERLRFTVADNGPGIEPRFHARIFEIFQTLQPKDEVESTGIGLSIVKKAVELYGGTIELKSEPGAGTEISFDWPWRIDIENGPEQKRAA